MDYPDHLKYSEQHEWVAVDGDQARIGITAYAEDALGDVVYVQLPDVGTAVTAASSCGELESTKAVSDVYAPVSGTVLEVNTVLVDAPETLNRDPYGNGWLLTVQMTEPSEVNALMDATAYRSFLEQSS